MATKNWPHEIILFLLDHYSETTTELNRFCKDNLLITETDLNAASKIRDILNNYEKANLLIWKAMIKNQEGRWEIYGANKDYFGTVSNEGKKLDFITYRIEAQLTIAGLDYSLAIKAGNESHKSAIITNKISRRSGIWSAFFAGATVLATIWSLFNQNTQNEKVQERLLELQNRLKILEQKKPIPQPSPNSDVPKSDTAGKAKKT